MVKDLGPDYLRDTQEVLSVVVVLVIMIVWIYARILALTFSVHEMHPRCF